MWKYQFHNLLTRTQALDVWTDIIYILLLSLFAFSPVLSAQLAFHAIRFNQHTIIILSINILPASKVYIETRSELGFAFQLYSRGYLKTFVIFIMLGIIAYVRLMRFFVMDVLMCCSVCHRLLENICYAC